MMMDKKELKEILQKHKDWKNHKEGGEQADLRGADLQRANLQGADLQGAHLQEADLQEADLQEADLQEADLQGAYLQGADLRGANLRGANLRGANLRWANLRGANLRWAHLQEANLQGAHLQEADLQEAYLQWANLQGASLQWANLQGARYALLAVLRANWGKVSDALCLEMMRWDAVSVEEEMMKKWAVGYGSCPFAHHERELYFEESASLWKPGKPRMSHLQLWRALCKEKNIQIDR